MNYRIKHTIHDFNHSEVRYYAFDLDSLIINTYQIQRKFLWFWIDVGYESFSTYKEANDFLCNLLSGKFKYQTVRYLKPNFEESK